MAIKKLDHNLFKITAVVKYKGKQFKRVRERFKGTEQKALVEYNRLHGICLKKAEAYREQIEHPFSTLDKLIDRYIKIKQPSDISSYNRLKVDCGTYEVSAENLKTKFLGGTDEYGNPIIGYVQLLENEHARRFQRSGLKGSVVETTRKLGANSKNKIYRAIKNLCQFAVEQGQLKYNPIQERHHWKEIPRSRTLSDEEDGKIIESLKKKYPYYLPLYLHCPRNPCRIGDIRDLTRDELFLKEQQIRYVSSKGTVPVVHVIYDDVLDHFQNLPPESKYLFYYPVVRKSTGKISYRKLGDFKKAWKAVLKENNIKDLKWHDLRHHSLTELFNNPSFTVRHAMLIGGWKQRSTIEIYHNIDGKKTAMELNELLLPKKSDQGKTPDNQDR